MLKRISLFLKTHSHTVLWGSILCFVAFSFSLSAWKFLNFQYNALDLGIFTQVIYETSQGNWFQFTIHPSLYLGDHLGFILLPIALIYKAVPSPLTLLFLQSTIIAFCSIPLYFITRSISHRNDLGILVVWIWLLNPYVHNMLTFEFHLLPFAMFFGFWMFYFYHKGRFGWFSTFFILALLVREDVALFSAAFGILGYIEKRSKKWILFPIILSAIYFLMSMQLVNHFNPDSSYKFLQYYSWIEGSTILSQLLFLLTHPIQILAHLFHPGNILFFIALFIPVLFLSFVRIRFLVLGVFIFLQYALSEFFGSPVILQTHYTALLLPGIFIALIYGFSFLSKPSSAQNFFQKKVLQFFKWDTHLFVILFACGVIYSAVTWGTLFRGSYSAFQKSDSIRPFSTSLKALTNSIPEDSAIISSYRFLANLAERSELYSLHYTFIGQQQYSKTEYPFPSSAEYILMDSTDVLFYEKQFSKHPTYESQYPSAQKRLRESLNKYHFGIKSYFDSYILWEKDTSSSLPLYSVFDRDDRVPEHVVGGNLLFFGHKIFSHTEEFLSPDLSLLSINLEWGIQSKTDDEYRILLEVVDEEEKTIYEKKYPMVHGLFGTSTWDPTQNINVRHAFAIPNQYLEKNHQIRLSIYTSLSGHPSLNAFNTAELHEKMDISEKILTLPVSRVFP